MRRNPVMLFGDQDVEAAAVDVMAWGYPRAVTEHELAASTWYRYGDDVIWWFEPGLEPDVAGLHMAIAPQSRSRVYARSCLEAIRIAACIWGYTELVVCNPGTVVACYLQRMGLERHPRGWRWAVQAGGLDYGRGTGTRTDLRGNGSGRSSTGPQLAPAPDEAVQATDGFRARVRAWRRRRRRA